MTSTFVIVCYDCGGLFLAKTEQKTRTCPYCGRTVVVHKARKLAVANTAAEASAILRRLKSDAANR